MNHLGFFSVLGAPLAAALLFAGILAYLGVHIVRRQVIFVDLALGQTAALGVLVGLQFGIAPESAGAQVFAVGFALVAAAIFAGTGRVDPRIPHEAVIGVVFALTTALTFIVVDRSPHGAEHVTDILTGAILWARWGQVAEAAVIVGLAVALIVPLHRRFLQRSGAGEGDAGLIDFLFYACFGLVISVTVRTAGVLPTFAMLVAPAILGGLLADRFRVQFAVAWGASSAVAVGALGLSYAQDLPGGPTLVATHGVVLLAGALVLFVVRATSRRRAAALVGAGVVVSLLLVAFIVAGGQWLARSAWANPDREQPVVAVSGGGHPC